MVSRKKKNTRSLEVYMHKYYSLHQMRHKLTVCHKRILYDVTLSRYHKN